MDVRVFDHGSLIGIMPLTDLARAWIDENVDPDAPYLGRQMMVERRYAPDIIDALSGEGFEVDIVA